MRKEDSVLMLRFTEDFEDLMRNLKIFTSLLLLSVFFVFPQVSIPQTQDSFLVIEHVAVEMEGQLEEDMAALIPLKVGEPYSLKRITDSIKQLYKTGLFSDIQVVTSGDRRVRLTYVFTKRFLIDRIYFLNKGKISAKKLKEELDSIREGTSFYEGKLSRAAEELKNIIEKEGYFSPEIRTFTEKDVETSSISVFFEIRSPKRYLVKKIRFLGSVVLPEKELKEEMKTKENEMFVPSLLEKDLSRLKQVYDAADYRRAEIDIDNIDFDEKEKEVSIIIRVTPNERIEIEIRGADVPLRLIKAIWEERIFEEWGLAEGKAKIINYLRQKGYLFSSVFGSIEREEEKMRVVYSVDLGKKYKIQDISFEGVEYFTPSELREALGIREKLPFVPWLSGPRLFELPREIEALYKREGFSETRVDLDFITEDRKVIGDYCIKEGMQAKIENISIKGTRVSKKEELLKKISSFEGGPFFLPNVQRDVERLEDFYRDQGFRGTEIKSLVETVSENLYSVLFEIKEGLKVRIDKVIITGNKITKKGIILRELRIKEGDYAYYESIRETKRRLEKLGIFSEIRIEEVLTSPQKENLIISVREGDRNYISLGLGLETKNEPRTSAIWDNAIRLRGTAELIRNNIFGSASQISLVGQFSLKEKRGVISWEQPYLFGLPLQTFVNTWLEREERKSFSFDRRGVSVTSVEAFSENWLFLMTLRWVRTTLFNLQIAESEVDRQQSPYSVSSISGSIIWDGRDDPFNPQRGSFFSFALEWAYPLFRAESDFIKNFIKFQNFLPVYPGITFNSTFRLGLGRGQIPIHERFFAGGSNSFRGEEFDELGPKDPDFLKPVGGKALILLNFELSFSLFPSFKNLYGVFFYDKGNVFAQRQDFRVASLRDAIGIGMRYRTPLGPIRFELGWNMDAAPEEKKILAFITIGNVF